MIQLLDKLIDEKQQEVVIVKMDIMTYNTVIKKDPTIELHKMESEVLNSKGFDNLDDLFNDLEN